MSDCNQFELDKLQLEKSLLLRNYEIDNFWKRGWFFGALLLAILTGYFGLKKDHPNYCIIISFLGILISLFQSLMNRGSKYWQERWEIKTKHQESVLGVDITKTKQFGQNERYYLDAGILAKNENWFVVARRFSVSKLTFLVWDIITLFWAALWLHDCNFNLSYKMRWDVAIFHAVIIVYIGFFFFSPGPRKPRNSRGGKVYERFLKNKNAGSAPPPNIHNPYFEDSEKYIKNDSM